MFTMSFQSSRLPKLAVVLALVLCLAAVNVVSATPGEADPSFGGGLVTTDFDSNQDAVNALAVQVDGKIVAAGETRSQACTASACDYNIALARYHTDGTLDPTFGSGGRVITDLSSAESAYALAIQPDGKLIVAGAREGELALIRYNTDGSRDPRFGVFGVVTASLGPVDRVNFSVVVQGDGGIVVGSATGFTLARYTPEGKPDTSFGGTGRIGTGAGTGGAIGVFLLPNGGLSVATVQERLIRVSSFTAVGSVDTAGSADGTQTFALGGGLDAVTAFAGQLHGKLIAVGYQGSRYALARFNLPSLTPDITFGSGGIVVLEAGPLRLESVYALAAAEDGKIVIGGTASDNFAVARVEGIAPGSVLLQENFDRPAGGSLPGDTTTLTTSGVGYVGGEYAIRTLRSQDGPRGAFLPGIYGDVTLAIDVRIAGESQGRAIALGCRDQSPGNYQLYVRSDGVVQVIVFDREGSGHPLGTVSTPALRRGGERNRIELSCTGTVIAARINGVLVISVEDARYRIGSVYLAAGVTGEGPPGTADVRFDNLTLTRGGSSSR